jgi:ribonuclease P protein component
MAQALKRFEILKSKTLFNEIFERGTRIQGKILTLICFPSSTRLVGFTVTKTCKTAAKRNYCKRLLRELFRKNKHDFGKYMFILHIKSLTNLNYNDLNNDFLEVVQKYKVFDAQVNNCCH